MTRHQAEELRALAKSYALPNDDKLRRRVENLERMLVLYEADPLKAPDNFIETLTYAITVIKMYRKLTIRLAEIAAEGDDHALRTYS